MKLIASQLELLLQRARLFLEQLDLPSRTEFLAAASAALRDVRAASASSWHLLFISFRPLYLLLSILGHYLALALRFIGKHSVAHGWRAAQEGYRQSRTATIWFVHFQRELPASAKYAEAGACALAVLLWLLRRYVRQNRYVERVAAWYGGRKRRAVRKYQRVVERLAQTSSFLALLLPHILYVAVIGGAKRMFPVAVTHLATRTYLRAVLGFWHPLYATFGVLRRLAPHLEEYRKSNAAEDDQGSETVRALTPSMLKKRDKQDIEVERLRVEAVDLLKYWVVYAILLAGVRTGQLLPFVGSRVRLTGNVVEEITLLFFVWLRLMPTPLIAGEVMKNAHAAAGARTLDKYGPADILFSHLSPYALGAMNSSAFLAKKAMGDSSNKDSSTLVSIAIQKLRSLLDLCVLVRMISKGSRDWLVTTVVESSALLPAAATLVMPGYFTKFGVLYVSLVVPAGYSTAACNALRYCRSPKQLATRMPKMDAASRYLQFWLVHAAVSLLLGSASALLAWLPFSTHATWLLWAYVQRDSTTRRIYSGFVRELGHESLEDSALVWAGRRVLAALPSNVEPVPAQERVGDENGASAADDGKNKVATSSAEATSSQDRASDANSASAADGEKTKIA